MIFAARNKRAVLLLAALASGAACAQSDAQSSDTQPQLPGVYKWADHKGVLHYDDASLTEPRLTLDILDARRIAPAPDQGVPSDYASEVGRRCTVTRDRLQDYQGARALYGRDPSGNVYQLSPTQAALTLAALGRDQSRYCGPDAAKKLYRAAADARRVVVAVAVVDLKRLR